MIKVAVAGLGAIGLYVARKLDAGMPGLSLAAVSARDHAGAEAKMADFRSPVPVLPLAELAGAADVVVESVPAASFAELAEPAVEAGRVLMVLSVGALLPRMDLVERAKETGAQIIVPTGALLGLDAVRAAAEGEIERITLVSRKPPRGLAGAPYLEQNGISLEGLSEPLKLFEGNAREAAVGFPANLNIAVALALAGVGPERTTLEIWADPSITRNTHTVKVESDAARFEMTIESVPSTENPRTGRLTPLSVIAALRRLTATLQIGT